MLSFLARRLMAGLATLFSAIFLMYLLVNKTMDPLKDLVESTKSNKQQLIDQRIELLDLKTNVVVRFFKWLGNYLTGDPGTAWKTGQDVGPMISHAIGSTLQLVLAATLISIVLGVTVGIVSALRQYSSFDYLIIFMSFLLYSLPSFLVAVLLKQWGAIGFNDFLADPVLPWGVIIVVSLLSGLIWSLAVGGSTRRRLQVGGSATAASIAMLGYLQASNWWTAPSLGAFLIAVLGAGAAVGIVAVGAGLQNRRALYSALATVGLGVVLYYPMQALFRGVLETNVLIFFLGVVAVGSGILVGWLFGGPDRGVSMRIGGMTALVVAALTYIDQVLQVWPDYSMFLRGRPIPTFGDQTPSLGGSYWVGVLDTYSHLILPSLTLILIAFASYARYSRSSMLEVMNQDYIRTARAKGLPERVVVVRHGFRNTLIPLATIIPIDIITLIGGAIITENIFARPGMGQLFIQSLGNAEIEPVMAYLVITASLAIAANIIADIIYASVDPRIRLEA